MNKSLMTGIGIGVVVAVAVGAVVSLSMKGEPSRAANVEQSAPLALADEATANAGNAQAEGAVTDLAQAQTAATKARDDDTGAARGNARSGSAAARSAAGSGREPSFARVVASTPVVQTEKVAREVCHDVQVQRQKEVKDEDRVAGTALGAVVGGVLGNQVGGGDGRKLATAAGVIAGGIAGNKIQKRMQQGNLETVTEKQCETVYDTKEKTVGYDVRYRVGESVQTVRMTRDPGVGAQLPLRDGKLIAQTAAKGRENS